MKKLLLTTKLALAIILAVTVIKFIFIAAADDSSVGPANASAGPAEARSGEQTAGADDKAWIGEILKARPFGDAGRSQVSRPVRKSRPPEDAGSTYENYKLSGTISGPEKIARAIILNTDTDETASYKTGSTIGSARLTKIEDNHVVLYDSSTEKTITLSLGNGHGSSSTETVIGTPGYSYDRPATARPANGGSDKDFSLEQILSQVKIEPATEHDGAGLKLSNVKDIPLAAKIGLQDGDIVKSINGQVLTSKPQAFQVLKKARSQPDLNIVLERKDREKRIIFPMN